MKLNLGAGQIKIDGYLSVDHEKFPETDIVADVKALPFKEGEIDEIYASSVLCYYGYKEVNEVLKEWHRVLTTKGKLLISMPDIMAIVEYINKNGFDRWIADFIYSNNEYYPDVIKSVYDFNLMKINLEEAGFTNVYRVDKFGLCDVDGSCCTARDQIEHKQIPMVFNCISEKA